MASFSRILSLGQSDSHPARFARHLRVANALALLGVVLALASAPLDAYGGLGFTVAIDLAGGAVFGSVWYLNARGYHDVARATLMTAANVVILVGVIELGGGAEIRAVFFPLVLLPFLVLGASERTWLAVFITMPIISYFITGQIETRRHDLVHDVYNVYAPALAFTALAAGSVAFALIDRNAEHELLQTRVRATNNARLVALGEMSSGVAHEIRNPLAAIHLAATQIAENRDPQVAQLGERIQRIVMRATRITETLRSVARDASGDPIVTASVEHIIADTLELCAKRITETGVVLTVTPVSPDLVIECRPVQLSQVLLNLLSNAYDAVASEAERWVRVDVTADAERVEIAVTDSGPGIPAPTRARIFEPFFTTKTSDRGTGLGLSLSRGLVEAHHGTLELDEASQQTRLVMRVPRVQPASREP